MVTENHGRLAPPEVVHLQKPAPTSMTEHGSREPGGPTDKWNITLFTSLTLQSIITAEQTETSK